MGNILENLVAAIESLEANVKSGIEEMRQQKREVQQIQENIRMDNPGTRYVRDEHCLILSAPNIIIGNVDSTGRLYSGGSKVTIRGNMVSTEATGDNGEGIISQRASTIENIAVDPGIDGMENVVFPTSRIVNHARSITMQSDDEYGTFTEEASTSVGVNILSDNVVNISALAPNLQRKDLIDEKIQACQETSDSCAEMAVKYKEKLQQCIDAIGEIVTDQEDLNGSDDLIATNYEELYGEQHDKFKYLEQLLYSLASEYISCLSMQAEAERNITSLEATKTTLEENTTDFDTEGTVSSIAIKSESVFVTSTDGDGSIRSNDSAGIFVNVPHFNLFAHDIDGALIENSSMSFNVQDIDISTASVQYDSEEHTSAQIPALGDITITSKNVTIQAIDNQYADDAITETALTVGSTFSVRSETMSFNATDTEGNASGSLNINALATKIAAMNVDKETRADKEMATGSTMYVQSEKTLVGTSAKAQLIQLASDKVAVIAKTTAEMQQDGKAVVTLTGGNMTAGGSAVEIDGATSIKGAIEAPAVTADSVTANSAFKSPTISDSMGASSSSATSPSATLTEEEMAASSN